MARRLTFVCDRCGKRARFREMQHGICPGLPPCPEHGANGTACDAGGCSCGGVMQRDRQVKHPLRGPRGRKPAKESQP